MGIKNRLFHSDPASSDAERWSHCGANVSLACAAMNAFVAMQQAGAPLSKKDIAARVDVCKACPGMGTKASLEKCKALIHASQDSAAALIAAVQTILFPNENLLVYVR